MRYGPRKPDMTGYSGNISSTGIMIRAIRVFGPGTILHLEIHFPEKIILARGRVQWAREGTVQLLATGRIGMGVKFIDPPQELLDLIAT